MTKALWQVRYVVDGLIPRQVRLKGKVWLKKGEILLEKERDRLEVHVMHEGEHTFQSEDKILPYFKFAPLLTSNSVHIEGGSAIGIASKREFGKNKRGYLQAEIAMSMPDDAARQVEEHAPRLLRQMGKLHNKYIDVVDDNRFLSVAVDFLFDANNKSVYSDDGFLCAVICLEALFNEGPSDISYKIAHRAALVIGLWKADPLEVARHLKSAYRDRNKLAHGGGSLDADHNPNPYNVIHYARTAIKIFMVLLSKEGRRCVAASKRKEMLLSEIDCAMLDISKRRALQNEVRRGMKSFELDVPRTFEGKGTQGGYRVTPW